MTQRIQALVLVLLVSCVAAFPASYTSSQSGNWNQASTWGGAGVPGAGDTCTISNVTVTLSDSRTVGTDVGGSTACSVTGTGALTIASGGNLSLHGDLSLDRATTFAIQAGGSLTFDPAAGNIHKVVWTNTGSAVMPVFNISGNGWGAGQFAAITTSARGGANGWFDGNTSCRTPSLNWAFAKFTNVGGPTQIAGNFGCLSNVDVQISNVIWVGDHLYLNWTADDGTHLLAVDRLDLRTPATTTTATMLTIQNDRALGSGTRTLRNATLYNRAASVKSIVVGVRALTVGVLTSGSCTTAGIYSYNVNWSESAANNHNVRCVFMTGDVALSQFVTPSANAAATWEQFAFYSHFDNPHYLAEAGNKSLTANVYKNGVCDGDNFFATDGGDFVIPTQAATVTNNILINACGTLATMLGSNGVLTARNNTIHGYRSQARYGAALGETTGAATQLSVLRNNLIVNTWDGLHEDAGTNFVRQSGASVDYNGFWQMPGSSDPGAPAGIAPLNLRHPLLNAISYVSPPLSGVSGLTNKSATAGSDATHVACTSCDFVTGSPVIVGDFVQAGTSQAVVGAITDATHLVLSSPGISGFTSGSMFSVKKWLWNSTSAYGDDDKGQHDLHADPMFQAATRTLASWDSANGGNGTVASVGAEIVKLNGFDKDGNVATFNTNYTVASALDFIRTGFTPTNPAFKNAGDPRDGNPDIGAVPVSAGSRRRASVLWR